MTELVEVLRKKIESLLEKEAVELVDLLFQRQGKRSVLKLLVDKAGISPAAGIADDESGGITLDECMRINRKISRWLDKDNLIENSLILEVSSPGIDRPLITEKDFIRNLGRTVRVVINSQIEGSTVYVGRIKRVEKGELQLETKEGKPVAVPLEAIVRAKKVISFGSKR